MSGFSAEWLSLRAPHDARARDAGLIAVLAQAHANRATPLRVLDLGAGIGGLAHALAPALGRAQAWTMVDHDPALLDEAARVGRAQDLVVAAEPRNLDLIEALDALPWAASDLVTASALLDLVSRPWLERLADLCASHRIPLYAPLSVDGRVLFTPPDEDDAEIAAAVARHQRGDKGFGRALGPDAASIAATSFGARRYRVRQARADWRLGPDDRAVQQAFVAGWRAAAGEIEPARADAWRAWEARRRGLIDNGRSRLTVGHLDTLALPPA